MDRTIKILGIAPYKGLATLMTQYARTRRDIELTVMTGNLQDGAKLAASYYAHYDVIISRANTANLISQAVPIPVVDIGIGYYDVLRCIRMAENTKAKFAIVGFRTLTSIATTLCDLLKIPGNIYPIDHVSETKRLYEKLKSENCQIIICDAISYDLAKEAGMTPILLTSSMESVEAAVDQAIYSWKCNQALHNTLSMMTHVLDTSLTRYLIMNTDGSVLYSTIQSTQAEDVRQQLENEIKRCRTDRKRSFFITIGNQMYSILANYVEDAGAAYVIFRVMPSEIPLAYSKYGITIMDKSSANRSFLDKFCGGTNLSDAILKTVDRYSSFSSPVMITGEIGTGKDWVAHILYARSIYSDNPLYVVNCSLLSDKSWNFVTNDFNSPFTDNGNTIYISNMDKLPHNRQKQLLSIIVDTNVHIRNHLIFSSTQASDGSIPHAALEYLNTLSCAQIPLKPLREQLENLPSCTGPYINKLNQRYGKQLVGLDDDAMNLLMEYDYPQNWTQFKRILKEAVLKSNYPYLMASTLREILDQESKLAKHNASSHTHEHKESVKFELNLNQPLDAINRDIIQYVLQNLNGNQSAAAKQLGIGRTTLWRYLNR